MAEQGVQMNLAGAAVETLGFFLSSFTVVLLLPHHCPASRLRAVRLVSRRGQPKRCRSNGGHVDRTRAHNTYVRFYGIVFVLAVIAAFAVRLSSV